MAGAYSAASHDIFSGHYNPASLSRMKGTQVAFQRNQWFQDVEQNYLAMGTRLGSLGVVSSAFNWTGMGDMRRTTVASGQAGTTIGTFDAHDYAVSLSWAKDFSTKVDLGVTTKIIGSKIDNQSGLAFAVDGGLRYRALPNWDLGVSVLNAGTDLKLVSAGSPLPLGFRAGTSATFFNKALMFSADISGYRGDDFGIGVGAEYTYNNMLSVRAGYDSRNDDADEGLTAGAGFQYESLKVDYAYTPFGDLGNTHRMSLAYAFDNGQDHVAEVELEENAEPAKLMAASMPEPVVTSRPEQAVAASEPVRQAAVEPAHRIAAASPVAVKTAVAPERRAGATLSEYKVFGTTAKTSWVALAAKAQLEESLKDFTPEPGLTLKAALGVIEDREIFLALSLYRQGTLVHAVQMNGTVDHIENLVLEGSGRLVRFARTGQEQMRVTWAGDLIPHNSIR